MSPATMRASRAGGVAALILASLVLPDARERVSLRGQVLTVPDGFEVELVAGPPLVERPIVADFDDDGRLYVADSSGSNDKVEKQLADRPHRIVRLEDTDGDGRYDDSRVFADRMMLPQGTLWFDGSLYVAAPPSIWKLTDTDADGVADRREEWFQGKTLTNCANDLHGPYLGPDGWIYWTKGAFAQQTYERPGAAPLVTRAAHIFRRRPGDTLVEPVLTGGMDNPVEVAFTSSGERMLTATFLEHPQLGRRDALIHAVYGGVYGKPHAVLDGQRQTGDLLPAVSHFGPAAPSGLARYASRVLGDEYRDNFFATLFNLHKVTRHELEREGSSFKSRDTDFLVSDSLDFHPTDVLEDADGSLLVVDTGAWYKLCCPTSQLAKPDVPGAIYRVRRKGAPAVPDPRGRRLAWPSMTPADLAARLDDPRPAVQARAIDLLARRPDAVAALERVLAPASSADARRNAVWALTRIEAPQARSGVRTALTDRDERVRLSALHAVGLWRDRAAVPALLDALQSKAPAVQRSAAEALGRIGDARAVPALLSVAGLELDQIREHSVIYALIEIGDPASTAAGLQAAAPRARRAALIALDQIDRGGLQPDTVVALLDSRDPIIKDAAWWVVGRHPEWGVALAGFFGRRLSAPRLTGAERDELVQQLSRFGGNAGIQSLLATTVERGVSRDARLIALQAMARSRAKELPAVWLAPLIAGLTGGDPELARASVAVARASPPAPSAAPELKDALLRVARDAATPVDVRLDALATIEAGLTPVDPALFDLLSASLAPDQPAAIRVAAAGVVARVRLDRAQLSALARTLESSGPLELPRLLPAFDSGSDEALGFEMLAALERSKGRASLRPDVLRPRLAKYPAAVQQRGEALLSSLDAAIARQAARLEQLLATARGGDLRRGQMVFNGPKGACSSCHAIGYQGGRIGPDLTAIGQIRSERDLLEAIVFPNASFPRGYESVIVTTTSGQVHSGILRNELADELVVATGEREEVRIPRQTIADMQPGSVSLMPAGFGDQLSLQELADLLAFLKATRWGA